MRPGASRLPFAAACLIAAGAFSPDVLAASLAGVRPGMSGYGTGLGVSARPTFGPGAIGRGMGWNAPATARFGRSDAFERSRVGFGHDRTRFGRYGRGFGFGGVVLDCAFFGGCCAAETGPAIVEHRIRPEWPTAIGIPPSPVQPPAIYVIGGERRNASLSRRTTRK
jgi:hypothetical protein